MRTSNLLTFIYLAFFALLLGLWVQTLQGQTLPDAPTPRLDKALYAADFTVRTLDFVSTHRALSNPCGCFHEADPIAPSGTAATVAFQYGIFAAVTVGSRYLRHHNHTRIARALIVADIVSESIAVQGNFRLTPPRRPLYAPVHTPTRPITLTALPEAR